MDLHLSFSPRMTGTRVAVALLYPSPLILSPVEGSKDEGRGEGAPARAFGQIFKTNWTPFQGVAKDLHPSFGHKFPIENA